MINWIQNLLVKWLVKRAMKRLRKAGSDECLNVANYLKGIAGKLEDFANGELSAQGVIVAIETLIDDIKKAVGWIKGS